MPRKAPTLQTIADLAGVSRNTVSCALRSDPRISQKTQERIRQIATEVGYRPNPMVSALMQSLRQSHGVSQSANLGFVHSFDTANEWQTRTYYHSLFLGAKQRASEMGYSLTPIWGMEPGLTVERMTGILRSRNVLGLIMGPIECRGELPIDWNLLPMAAMGASLRKPQLHRAATYFTHTIPRAWHELQALGYRRIGVMFSDGSNRRVDFALEAGCAILRENLGVQDLPVVRTILPFSEFRKWVEDNQLDAIISSFGGAIRPKLEKMGLRIPEDIALVNLMTEEDDGAYIERDWGAIGAATVDLVIGQLLRNERGVPAKPKTVLIEGEWHPGNLATR